MPGGRWVGALFLCLAIVAGVFLVFASADERVEPVSPAVPTSQSSIPPPAPPETSFLGVILPFEAVEMASKLDGVVAELYVSPGQPVAKGQLLARLDTERIATADIEMANAALRSSRADMERLQIELSHSRARLERATKLWQEQILPKEQVDDARFQEQLAISRVKSAETAVLEKEALVRQRNAVLDGGQVRAPFDGLVSVRYVTRGTPVSRGTPVFRIVRTTSLRIRAAVPAHLASSVRAGMLATAHVSGTAAMLRARVESVSPEIDSAAQMFIAELSIEETGTDTALMAGRSVMLRVGSGVETR